MVAEHHAQCRPAMFATEYVVKLNPGFLEDSDGVLARRNKDLVPTARADESRTPYGEVEGDNDWDLAELIINEDEGNDVFVVAEVQKQERMQEQPKEEMRRERVASSDGAEITVGKAVANQEKKQEVDESAKVADVPVSGERREKGWLDGVSDQDLRRKRERSVSGKSPRSKIVCGNSGAGVVEEFQGVSVRGPESGVSQEPGPGRAEDPRSPLARQVWVKWGGHCKAVDSGRHMREEIECWLGVESEQGLYLVCDGRRMRWEELEGVQEWKVVEVMAGMRGGRVVRRRPRKED